MEKVRQCINRNDLAKVTKTKKKKKTHQNIKANIIINIRINKKNPKIINRRTHKAKKLNKMKKKEKVKLLIIIKLNNNKQYSILLDKLLKFCIKYNFKYLIKNKN